MWVRLSYRRTTRSWAKAVIHLMIERFDGEVEDDHEYLIFNSHSNDTKNSDLTIHTVQYSDIFIKVIDENQIKKTTNVYLPESALCLDPQLILIFKLLFLKSGEQADYRT